MLDSTVATSSSSRPISLDALAALDTGALVRLFRESVPPRTLAPLENCHGGRLLALAPPFDRARRWLAPLAGAPIFPWVGKNIRARTDREGEGQNRFHLLGERVAFRARYDRSVLDSERCVVFDYDLPDNPAWIRVLMDELREAAPGVFFGPAFRRTRTEPKLLLFFALAV